ncbi:DUF7681 family protein [Burkholderia cenocepacia]|uniref:Acb2/Tad1 domain-containing protein n=1 Tax=Burkholderia cenocepacia TaxID=95486 RepID=UPI001B9D9B8D|nr:hypothetical protein [Burkholderia cenocepacia]MBR8475822.1 hypothetical protein [Burkholderia cenocepacia]
MDNQHKHIKGYRDLSQEEIDLMNEIKEKGAELLAVQAKVSAHLAHQDREKRAAAGYPRHGIWPKNDPGMELYRFDSAEPHRWAAIAKTDIQTGIMALVRAVAQPEI